LDIVLFHLTEIENTTQEGIKTAAETFEIGALRWTDGALAEPYVRRCARLPSAPTDVPMEEALPGLLKYIEGRTLVSFYPETQLRLLRQLCDEWGYVLPISSEPLDLRAICRVLYPTHVEDTLTAFLQLANVDIPDSTAQQLVSAQGELLTRCYRKAKELPYVTLQHLARLGAMYATQLGQWFQRVADVRFHTFTALPDHCDQIHQLAFTRVQSNPSQDSVESADETPDSDLVAHSRSLLMADSPLAKMMRGFEVRKGQMEMVEAVAEALEGDTHLLAEAGTGTGKSLAYLIPAALYAIHNDTRVVVSTHTISLQDQIAKRDFPLLRQVIQHPLSLSVFKGRTHYVCMRKLLQEVRSVGFASSQDEIEAYMKLLVWLTETEEGNREELRLQGKLTDVWPRVQSETETCINKRCPFFKPCYYFRARGRAYEADVIVTNHSLILSDVKANHRVLPRYDKLILDEAHHLEEEATKHLGDEVHQLQCSALIGRLSRDNGKHGVIPELLTRLQGSDAVSVKAVPALELVVDTLRELRGVVETTFATFCEWLQPGENVFRITRAVENTPTWNKYLELVDELQELLKEIESQAATISDTAEQEPDEDLAGRLFDAAGFLQELQNHVGLLCSAAVLSDDWVVWIEASGQGDKKFVSLHQAPIDVAKILRTSLFDEKSSVVLTSATLSAGGSFDYVMARLGLKDAARDGRLASVVVSSPFRYDRQALLCVPTDVPELAKMSPGEAAVWLSDSLFQYAKISRGRLLALFTSHAMLRATAEQLRQPLKTQGYDLFAQGVDGSRSYLLEAFRKHPESVLLGAQSFWEGIDLPGDQLTTLVIVRLPFAPPTHPVTMARHERLQAEGRSPFTFDSLPEAIVRFRQGFGRLIRTVHDRGVVVVMDKRIVTAKYGSSFLKSVPGVRRCIGPEAQVLQQMRRFLAADHT
jgi:ATP-dependent DNA helicase DinG